MEDITHTDEDTVPSEALTLCDGLVEGVGHGSSRGSKGVGISRGLIVSASAVEVDLSGCSWGHTSWRSSLRTESHLHSEGHQLLGRHSEVLALLALLLAWRSSLLVVGSKREGDRQHCE